MSAVLEKNDLIRPEKTTETAVPAVPTVDASDPDSASVQYSHYRTKLSNHRTGLSEHRTALSEYRTDLSGYRTKLSAERTEVSMRRTGMSFQRTRMSADRTLASVIRTSLSLITFGFTIFQFFEKLVANPQRSTESARNFGASLVVLGITMLLIGILYHVYFMMGLRKERKAMAAQGLIHAQSAFPPSLTLVTALILLAIGIVAILSMIFHIGPFA